MRSGTITRFFEQFAASSTAEYRPARGENHQTICEKDSVNRKLPLLVETHIKPT